jgi:hypothetical protein
MAQVARIFDPAMLLVPNLMHASDRTVLFQRLSVMAADCMLLYGAVLYTTSRWPAHTPERRLHRAVVLALLLLNTGLTIVDHIHFQYNGFLYGMLIVSVALLQKGSFIKGGVVFTVLLGFKHIYLYVAPAYFVYLFRGYCWAPSVVAADGAAAAAAPATATSGRERVAGKGNAPGDAQRSRRASFSIGRFAALGAAVVGTLVRSACVPLLAIRSLESAGESHAPWHTVHCRWCVRNTGPDLSTQLPCTHTRLFPAPGARTRIQCCTALELTRSRSPSPFAAGMTSHHGRPSA